IENGFHRPGIRRQPHREPQQGGPMFHPHDTITRILREHPAAARVFERHGMDYCCAGGTTLEAACLERGTSVDALITDLEELLAPAGAGPELDSLTLPDLVEHI